MLHGLTQFFGQPIVCIGRDAQQQKLALIEQYCLSEGSYNIWYSTNNTSGTVQIIFLVQSK